MYLLCYYTCVHASIAGIIRVLWLIGNTVYTMQDPTGFSNMWGWARMRITSILKGVHVCKEIKFITNGYYIASCRSFMTLVANKKSSALLQGYVE